MLAICIEFLTIVFLLNFLAYSFRGLEHELELNTLLEKEIYEKEYCARLYALEKNLEQTTLYLKKDYKLKNELIEAWREDSIIRSLDCAGIKTEITIYGQKSLELDPLYPNWSYYYSLSNPNDDLSSTSAL